MTAHAAGSRERERGREVIDPLSVLVVLLLCVDTFKRTSLCRHMFQNKRLRTSVKCLHSVESKEPILFASD